VSYLTDSFDDRVIELLKQGGVGLLPTDTIYGLSCRALDRPAVEKIRQLKNRDAHKPFIVLISDIKMLDLLSISKSQVEMVKQYWPGPLSVIFKAPGSPNWLHSGTKSLAVRMPNYEQLKDLIAKVGPIVSTSPNLHGEAPVDSAAKAKELFGDKLDFYVDAGILQNLPSTLVELKDGRLEVIRQGAVKISEKEKK
jgi:L-threonylcarbamoyladenylate synthase